MSVDIKGTVLVTGANGYIAGRVIEAFLLAGYHVRGTVRSASSVKALISALENYHNNFDVVEVPDITASGAFDEAVKGVDAVAHLAAPISLSFDDPDPVIKAAVEGTTSILDSAIREPSIKSVLLMSSIAAIIGIREEDYNYTEKDWNTWVEGLLQKLGKNAPGNVIYAAEKTLAEKAFWQFRDEKKPTFAMTSINPVFVAGPPLIAPSSPEKINETTRFVWNVLTGKDLANAGLGTAYPGYVDVRDVGRMFVFAVDHPDITNGERYLGSAGYGPPQAVADILRKAYPDRKDIIQEGKPGTGYFPDYRYPAKVSWDGSKTTNVMGLKYIPFDQIVLDTARVFEAFL